MLKLFYYLNFLFILSFMCFGFFEIDKYIIIQKNTNKHFNSTSTNTNSFLQFEYNFRKTKWGMTQKEVLKQEKQVLKQNNILLYCKYRFLDLDCYLYYQFKNNSLVNAGYNFYYEFESGEEYIKNYFKVYKFLKVIYGNTIFSQIFSVYDSIIHNKKRWGYALELGLISFIDVWETKETKIVLNLKKESNKKFYFILFYMQKKIKTN